MSVQLKISIYSLEALSKRGIEVHVYSNNPCAMLHSKRYRNYHLLEEAAAVVVAEAAVAIVEVAGVGGVGVYW